MEDDRERRGEVKNLWCWLFGHKFMYDAWGWEKVYFTTYCTRCGKTIKEINRGEADTSKNIGLQEGEAKNPHVD